MARRARMNTKKRNRRILTISIAVVIVAFIVVVSLIIIDSTSCPNCQYIGKPASTSVLQTITGVSDATLSTVGSGGSGVAAPKAINGSALTSGGHPEILYVGGEYCPYCAVERWSLILALSRFGTFSGIQYMVSSSTDVNANTPTFTFANATYTSSYITFVAVEEWDRSGNVRQTLTTDQQSLYTQYDPSGGIPFVDFANSYLISGVQTNLELSGQNWTKVAAQLNDPTSSTAMGIDGAANLITSAICTTLTNMHQPVPSTVCSQTYATLPLSYQIGSASHPVQSSFQIMTVAREDGTSML